MAQEALNSSQSGKDRVAKSSPERTASTQGQDLSLPEASAANSALSSRQKFMLNMQHQQGNAAVLRMLQRQKLESESVQPRNQTSNRLQRLVTPQPGSALDQVTQALSRVSPIAGVGDFPAAFSILDGLSTDELLSTLVDLQTNSQLDLLLGNRQSAAQFNQLRLVTAMQVVQQCVGANANVATAQATIAAAGLTPADATAMNNFALLSRVSTTHGADQRAAMGSTGAAVLPDSGLATEIGYELDPSSRPAPAAPTPVGSPTPAPPARIPWDGRTGAPGADAARATMQRQLFSAYDAYLRSFRPSTVAALRRPRVAFSTPAAAGGGPAPTGVVDIANQARNVLETRYSISMNAGATSASQLSARSPRQSSGPGQNLFDANSEADRSTLTGSADLAPGVAWWLFENDVPGAAGAAGTRRFATEILARHHYSSQDPGAEQFRWDVANAYAAASTLQPNNSRQLIDYRMTGWSERGTQGITLQSSFDPGTNSNRAELAERWEIFKTAVHESLHLRAHPAFEAAEQGRGTMGEGFVEMFTISTLADIIPRVRAGSLEGLRQAVEGALFTPTPDASIITDAITPAQYADHRAQAERIRDGGTAPGGTAHAGVGEAAVRAAFFEGHVEYIGLGPNGTQLTTLRTPGAAILVHIPGGITSIDDLARCSGVPRQTILNDNPGITSPLPASAVLSGCREHLVVRGETRANIAAQNGVSEAALARANPDIPMDTTTSAWPALAAGRVVLIPVH